MDDSFKIDFIGIGAAKAGTTWLADALRQHPDIFIPKKKELIYFCKTELATQIRNYRYEKPITWYHSFFKGAAPAQVKGEISPHYLNAPEAVEKIYQYNPEIKIIAALRNPVDRVVSHYRYAIQIGKIPAVPFADAINKYPIILKYGLYFKHLARYYNQFPNSNIKIILFDDIKNDPKPLYTELLDFLNVSPYLSASLDKKVNKTKLNRIPNLNYLIESSRIFIHKNRLLFLRPVLRYLGITPLAEFIRDHLNTISDGKQKTTLSQSIYDMLYEYYSGDVHKLEKLIDRDLAGWKRTD